MPLSKRVRFIIAVVFILSLPATTETIKIVAAGDSITNAYFPYLPASPAASDLSLEYVKIAQGGLKSTQFIGQVQHPSNSGLRDYTQETVNEQPDFIFFMLGTNDCASDFQAESNFLVYQESIKMIFDMFTDASSQPKVFVSTLIPIISPSYSSANERIDSWYNPWIQQTVQEYGFNLLDLNAGLRKHSNWQGLYNTDGIHLGPEGCLWMAQQWSDATATPEPCTLFLLSFGGIALRFRKSHRIA